MPTNVPESRACSVATQNQRSIMLRVAQEGLLVPALHVLTGAVCGFDHWIERDLMLPCSPDSRRALRETLMAFIATIALRSTQGILV